MRYLRIKALPTPDNPDYQPLWLDVIVDNESRIIGRNTIFGLQGDFESKEDGFWPFTLDFKGQVDFGTACDDEPNERYATLDLRDGVIEKGRHLIMDSINYGILHFRITEIIELPVQAT